MKVTFNPNDPLACRIAEELITKHLRDKFNLHPVPMARGIAEEAKKKGVDPIQAFQFLKDNMLVLVQQFLQETEVHLKRELGKK